MRMHVKCTSMARQPVRALAGTPDGDRSVCFKIVAFEGNVGSDPAIYLQGVRLNVRAFDGNGPLELVLTLDEEDPACELRVTREGTVPSDTYRMHATEFTWSLNPKV